MTQYKALRDEKRLIHNDMAKVDKTEQKVRRVKRVQLKPLAVGKKVNGSKHTRSQSKLTIFICLGTLPKVTTY